MTPERLLETGISEEEYDSLQDKYITIPPGPSGVAQEGDSIAELVVLGVADWKKPGVSLSVPITVVSEGINKGKQDFWYPGIEAKAMGITKRALKVFGIEDKVLRRVNGKVSINPMGFAGARAKATYVRSKTPNNNLIAKLDSTNFMPVDAASGTKDVGI